MTPNQIRNKALKVCKDHDEARKAWERVTADPRCHGKTLRAARLVMLQVLADGGIVADAEQAAREELA